MHLIVGRIVRPHGIRGELIVDVRTDDPQDRFRVGASLATSTGPDHPGAASPGTGPSGSPPTADGEVVPEGVRWTVPAELTIETVRAHQGRLILAFDGVLDRETAEELRGVFLWVDSATVSPLTDPDEFHDHELVGLTAVTPSGQTLGEVTKIDHAPAADLLVLRRTTGGTALVPFVKAIVPEVDVAGGRVVVDPPEGLFDL